MMRKLECAACRQAFWIPLDEEEGSLIQAGDWVQIACPRCGHPWSEASLPKERKPRGRRPGRKAGAAKPSWAPKAEAGAPKRRGRRPGRKPQPAPESTPEKSAANTTPKRRGAKGRPRKAPATAEA